MKFEPLCCSPPISSYMASQRLKTFKNNYSMWWVNVWLFLSAPSIKQPLCNSFYSLRTSSGGVTSTLVLHPLDLIKIRFQGKILGITWFCVTCKCLSNRKRFPCLHRLILTREGLGEFETVISPEYPKFKDRANWSHDTFQPMRRRACVYQQTNQNIAPVIKNFQNNGRSRTESVIVSRLSGIFLRLFMRHTQFC